MKRWDILTGEYPPDPGGVSDYTRSVAQALNAAGDQVHIWTSGSATADIADGNVVVHRIEALFGWRGLSHLSRRLRAEAGGVTLVQYVPHAFGWKAMNVLLCCWLLFRSEPVWIIFHEVAVGTGWRQPFLHNLIGAVNRAMAVLLTAKASRIWVTIPRWIGMLPQAVSSSPIECLPVPNSISVRRDYQRVAHIRSGLSGPKRYLLGHFGSYREENAAILMDLLPELFRLLPCRIILLGRNNDEFCRTFKTEFPEFASCILASGELCDEDLSSCLQACDAMVQPYPDGVSGRRTSMMACLAHGCPTVTNRGEATEDFWALHAAVRLTESNATSFAREMEVLLSNTDLRLALSRTARIIYARHFDLERTADALREAAAEADVTSPAPTSCHI